MAVGQSTGRHCGGGADWLLSERYPGTRSDPEWGWRIPFFIGCMIIPLIFVLRRSLQETDAFLQRTHRPDTREIFTTIVKNWRLIAAGTLLVAMTTTTFYFITVYTPTYGRAVLHLSARDSPVVTMLVGISNFIWLPIGGAISDRIGRRPVLMGITVLALITTAGNALAHRRARFHSHDIGSALVLILFWYV